MYITTVHLQEGSVQAGSQEGGRKKEKQESYTSTGTKAFMQPWSQKFYRKHFLAIIHYQNSGAEI